MPLFGIYYLKSNKKYFCEPFFSINIMGNSKAFLIYFSALNDSEYPSKRRLLFSLKH